MKKVLTFILNHAKALLAVVVFGVTFAVVGMSMLNSYNDYKAYEKRYNENDLAVRSAAEAAPQRVEVLDSFKTSLANEFNCAIEETDTSTTSIEIELEISSVSLVDIDFVATFAEKVDDVFAKVEFRVNSSKVEEVVEAPADEEVHIAMQGFALPEGKVTISIASSAGLPEIGGIIFCSNASIDFLSEAVASK